ncbi:MAG TPA: hypothetical protein VMV66_01190 [Candidatus Humimicrobiaceae bacterium]|nr:hypothetical protein [Candidatus Humimicrobiaceae bacterium]
MIEIIATIILICSLLGIGLIVRRKIPLLIELSEDLTEEDESFSSKLRQKTEELSPLKNFSYEIFLQKFISKIRILSLKTDKQTFNWLQKLREKSKKKTFSSRSVNWQNQKTIREKLDKDNYWEEIKRIKEKK